MVSPFEYLAGKLFFGRGGDGAMHAGQVYEKDFGSEFGLALAPRKGDGHAGVVSRVKAAARERVHKRGLARVRNPREANRQLFGFSRVGSGLFNLRLDLRGSDIC